MPKGVRFVVRTVPLPWQSGQVSAVVPAAQPLPWQSGHSSTRPTLISFLQPKAASSKVSVTPTRTLSPRCGPFRRAEDAAAEAEDVAQVAEYISKAAKAAEVPESAEAAAAPPPKPALGSKAACPNWSYFLRFSGSPSTWAASLSSLNFSSHSLSPGCRSGWYCLASFLYAFLCRPPRRFCSTPRTS